MKTVPLTQFRRKCSSLLQLVNEMHETIQITRFGLPLADIKPPGLSAEERTARDARELEIINRFADELNADALDALEYQVPVGFEKKKGREHRKKQKTRRR